MADSDPDRANGFSDAGAGVRSVTEAGTRTAVSVASGVMGVASHKVVPGKGRSNGKGGGNNPGGGAFGDTRGDIGTDVGTGTRTGEGRPVRKDGNDKPGDGPKGDGKGKGDGYGDGDGYHHDNGHHHHDHHGHHGFYWWFGGHTFWGGYGWLYGLGYYHRYYYPYNYYYPYPYYRSDYSGAYYSYPDEYYAGALYDACDPAPAEEEAYPVDPETIPVEDEIELPAEPQTSEPASQPAIDREAFSRAASHYLTVGDRAFRDARFGDAAHFYAKAVEFAPDEGVLYLILSDALFATGDYHYAAYALRKALELEPTLVTGIIDKHTFYADPSDFDKHLAQLETYLDDHFVDDDARLLLAANYLFGNRPAEAVDLLENPFSREVGKSPAGKLILESAKAIQYGGAVPEGK